MMTTLLLLTLFYFLLSTLNYILNYLISFMSFFFYTKNNWSGFIPKMYKANIS